MQNAIEKLNEFFADVLEYETKHPDAGNNYADLVDHVDSQDIKRQLEEEKMAKAEDGTGDSLGYKWVKKLNLNLRGLDLDTVERLVLDVLQMVPGSIFGPYGDDGLVLAAFAVQEIEIEIPEEFADIMDHIGENETDAYITGTGRAYIATDAVWYAVASVKDLQDAIDAEAAESV